MRGTYGDRLRDTQRVCELEGWRGDELGWEVGRRRCKVVVEVELELELGKKAGAHVIDTQARSPCSEVGATNQRRHLDQVASVD